MRARRTWPSGRAARSARCGRAGCFSFQASKNLNCAEGGAILTNDGELVGDVLPLPQQQPRPRDRRQHGLLLSRRRRQPAPDGLPGGAAAGADDAARATGAHPRRQRRVPHDAAHARSRGSRRRACTQGCTRNAYHLYMFRYDAAALRRTDARAVPQGAPRRRRARLGRLLAAARRSRVIETLAGRAYQRIYGKAELDAAGRTQPLPAERAPVHRSGVADADDAARPARATWIRSPTRSARFSATPPISRSL